MEEDWTLETAIEVIGELAKENKYLKRQIQTKDNALRHYANPKNISWPHIKTDGGRIARAALENKCWRHNDSTVITTPCLPEIPPLTIRGGKSWYQQGYEKGVKKMMSRVSQLEEGLREIIAAVKDNMGDLTHEDSITKICLNAQATLVTAIAHQALKKMER